MRSIIFTSLIASIATLTSATPAQKRQINSVTIFFYGVDDASFSQVFPTDLTTHEVDNSLVVHHIYNPGGANCFFTGAQGEFVDARIGDNTLDMPQRIVSGFCGGL